MCEHNPTKLKQLQPCRHTIIGMCVYLHIHRCVSACLYMQAYNSNTVQVGVYLCMRGKLGKFKSGSSQAGGYKGGRFVVWVGWGC